eukprot:CAMPEP_0119066892 /NCGR_PEP_ID=MMETSP1178-20130426/9310_1 /TAXON_ID=33656 /ORGANISM="unid sp, Strain CCMP2000" /LENGTH=124 /DNA_ID=CAMNT_0007048521 /DNA_START=1149 /DNA_END=1524 /DNA_ORIENTATION=+
MARSNGELQEPPQAHRIMVGVKIFLFGGSIQWEDNNWCAFLSAVAAACAYYAPRSCSGTGSIVLSDKMNVMGGVEMHTDCECHMMALLRARGSTRTDSIELETSILLSSSGASSTLFILPPTML